MSEQMDDLIKLVKAAAGPCPACAEKDAEITRLKDELRYANAPHCATCHAKMFNGRCFGCDRLSEIGR